MELAGFTHHTQAASLENGLREPSEDYCPVAGPFLTTSRPIPFRVYLRTQRTKWRLIIREGEILTSAKRRQIRSLRPWEQLWIPSERIEAALRLEEDVLGLVLSDTELDLYSKCRSFQNLLTLLTRRLFETPSGVMVYRVRETVSRLVDFAQGEPGALRILLGLAHRRYDTPGHSVNVGVYGLALAMELYGSESEHDLTEIAAAFFIHDIGKVKVHLDVRQKPGPLNESEWWAMRRHPRYGQRLLERGQVLTPERAVVVLQHHERMDGKGYPRGLSGIRIHPFARICAIADAFDALTTERSFRPALDSFAALKIMKDEMNAQFDPEMFKAFVMILSPRV